MANCFDNYITINDSTPSRSGLYATDLPGIDTELLDGIARSITEDHDDIWVTLYKRAHRNLVSDVSKNIQDKFYMDLKLLSKETSSFKDTDNGSSGLAGITLEFNLPKYAKLHVLSIGVYSEAAYASSDVFKIYDTDENGELLATITTAITTGRNTINIDTDFEADKIFISYNPALFTFRETENKSFANNYNHFDEVICDFCFYDPDYTGQITQINGGGLNIKFNVYCSIEKLVCENLNLFKAAFLYKIGQEITIERRLGERLNKFTVMIQERWDELNNFYTAQYQQDLLDAIRSQNIQEDTLCFFCKNAVYTDTQLP